MRSLDQSRRTRAQGRGTVLVSVLAGACVDEREEIGDSVGITAFGEAGGETELDGSDGEDDAPGHDLGEQTPDGPHGTCGSGGPVGQFQPIALPPSHYFVSAPGGTGPFPVVVALHGDEGSPDAVAWDWDPVWQQSRDFLLVLPQVPAPNGSWWNSDTQQNAAFLRAVLEDVATRYDVDIDRVYATGVSGGSTFLGWHGFAFQDVFAAIQWNCGGAGAEYVPPPAPPCKVDGRFVIATDDFLYDGAHDIYETMLAHGHEAEFVNAPCSGHCCKSDEMAFGAWAFFQARTKCDQASGDGCGSIDDLP